LGGQAGPVFLGTVLRVTDLLATDDSAFLSSRRARIRVDERFGGLAPDLREVDVYTGSGGGDCGIAFKIGEAYLVDAFVEKGVAHAGICSSTRRIDAAGVLLRVLRQRRDGLVREALSYYAFLASEVEIHATNAAESAVIDRVDDHTVEMIRSGQTPST